MSKALSLAKSASPAKAPAKAMKKAAKKAASKKAAGKGPKQHPHKHDEKSREGVREEGLHDQRRAFQHLARVAMLLAIRPGEETSSAALQAGPQSLATLYARCVQMFRDAETPARVTAEVARALEHLCFVSLSAAPHRSLVPLTQEAESDLHRHLQHDLKHQSERVAHTLANKFPGRRGRTSSAGVLLELASRSLATAEQAIEQKTWALAHECLRAADALVKAIDHL